MSRGPSPGARWLPGLALAFALPMAPVVHPAAGGGALLAQAIDLSAVRPVIERLGEPERALEARSELLRWLSTVEPERAGLWLRLGSLLERVPEETGAVVAGHLLEAEGRSRADTAGRRGGAEAVAALALEGSGPSVPALLGFAAHLAAEVDVSMALELRLRLLEDWPDDLHAPEAAIEAARVLPAAEALPVLDAMVVRFPEHPLAPEARRIRERALRGEGGR